MSDGSLTAPLSGLRGASPTACSSSRPAGSAAADWARLPALARSRVSVSRPEHCGSSSISGSPDTVAETGFHVRWRRPQPGAPHRQTLALSRLALRSQSRCPVRRSSAPNNVVLARTSVSARSSSGVFVTRSGGRGSPHAGESDDCEPRPPGICPLVSLSGQLPRCRTLGPWAWSALFTRQVPRGSPNEPTLTITTRANVSLGSGSSCTGTIEHVVDT